MLDEVDRWEWTGLDWDTLLRLSLEMLSEGINTYLEISSTGKLIFSMTLILLLIKPAESFAVYVCYKYNPPLLPCRNFFLSLHLSIRSPPSAPHPLSLPLNRTACPYFCSFVISPSPCLTTSAYCLFLSSGLFVSIILLTRSMVQGMRSAAMNLARSLF